MATSITPLGNMRSIVTCSTSSSQLKKVLRLSATSLKLLKCTSDITLSSSRFFAGGSLASSTGRRAGLVTSVRPDSQTTEDPLVENTVVSEVEDESVVDEELIKDNSEDEAEDSGDDAVDAEEKPVSIIETSLNLYKEALLNNDESKVAELESFLQSLEEEKNFLAIETASLSDELSSVKDKVLRISADFDNYRKRTERDRLSLVTNVQGDVVESLLPVLDNFERAKASLKLQTEGEEKINNSYQSIYNQFVDILGSLGVIPVETVGIPFDPMLHEAIMREDSSEFEEGVVIQEFRKGFKIGDKLLRPSMVKVSAGPGPAKEAGASEIPEADNKNSESGESS